MMIIRINYIQHPFYFFDITFADAGGGKYEKRLRIKRFVSENQMMHFLPGRCSFRTLI